MPCRRVLPLIAVSSAIFIIAASDMAPIAALAQSSDPFGDIDLNSLRKNRGAGHPVPATPAPQPPSERRRPSDPPFVSTNDPIGSLTPTGVFDRAKRVYVGKSPTGAVACYFREEGDSHRLDIGIAAPGAFVRLATPEPREATPTPPVRIFAGKEKTRRVGGNEFTTGEYTILKAYDGPVAFSVPEPKKGGFTAVGKADAKRFLEMVAAAKGEFVVVQSERGAKAANIVAVYRFDATMVPVLVSCAEKQGIATVEAAPAPVQVQSAASPENWTVYENARYGTTVEYPAGIFSAPEPPSENGDGRVFHSADGRARLTIYASHNLDGDSPQNYLNKYIGRDGLSFRRVTAAFFAISGTRDGDIFYQRCNFSKAPNDVIHCLAVSYPADQKTRWDATVDRMSRSLRAGQGIEAR